MTTRDPDLPQDPLDDCLEHARWPEPTGLQRNRLEARWDTLALERRESRRRLMRWTLAASVVLALGVGWGGWLLWKPGEAHILPPAQNITPPQIADGSAPKPSAQPLVRMPTRYEEAAFRMAVQHRQASRVARQIQPLVQTLSTLLDQPEASVLELSQPLQAQKAVYEDVILSRLAAWNRAEQHVALKLLQEIGSPRAIPVLDRLSRDPEFEKLAWPVALHLAPAKQLSDWAKTDTPAHRKAAIQELLSRKEDPEAFGTLLRLVALPDSRKLAIDVITSNPNPPVKELFAFLKQGTKEQRHTAGLVLGRIKNPTITQDLLALANEQSFPPEVMTGLLNSSDQQAAKFLHQAKRDPAARTAVQLACLEWELISYTSTLPQPLEIY